MKQVINVFFIVALAMSVQAQTIDKEKMHRDLEVAENALSTIISANSHEALRFKYNHGEIEADYVKDYGVIFMVSNDGYGKIRVFGVDEKVHVSPDNDKSDKVEASVKSEKEHFIENCKMFLADYAGIIGQLKDNQMISIRRGGDDMHNEHNYLDQLYFAKGGDANPDAKKIWANKVKMSNSEIVVEASVSKIKALRMGKISRDDFFKAVKVTENEMDYTKDADLETLSAMFHRLYKKDLSKTYYSERQPKYSKLTNFGVIVKMKFYSSYEDNKVYSMPTIGKEDLTLKERNKLVMELLPQFESDFIENLVNYGRTLKNLDSDEILLFEIDMTTCKDCNDFPDIMKFSIKKSVLHDFNRGSISLDKAINQVNVERIIE